MAPRYSQNDARVAVAASASYAETLRRLGMCPKGDAPRVLKKYLATWSISTEHFDRMAAVRRSNARRRRPLAEMLVPDSDAPSAKLKERLYQAGLKRRTCELCGQGEEWRGRPMSLILDHVNGVRTDNRLENLRIVCPNCNATLDTHCGRNARTTPLSRDCSRCGRPFRPKAARSRYCSRECGQRWERDRSPRPTTRRVDRPPHAQLAREVAKLGWSGTGRKHGVSDNAVRKWMRTYERE